MLLRVLFETYLFNLCLIITAIILGLTVSKLFLSFTLFDVLTISPSLSTITRSLGFNTKPLLITIFLILILIVSFTSITYYTNIKDSYVFLQENDLNICVNYF